MQTAADTYTSVFLFLQVGLAHYELCVIKIPTLVDLSPFAFV